MVQPSVVYETITWSGYIYDTYNDSYLRTDEPFTVRTQCTGFVVNPDGWVATAGHCVDPALGKEAIRRAAAEWALTSDYYTYPDLLTVDDVVGDYRVDTFDQVGHVVRNRVDQSVKSRGEPRCPGSTSRSASRLAWSTTRRSPRATQPC